MEVARPPGGFLMPHQMIYHDHEMRRPAPSSIEPRTGGRARSPEPEPRIRIGPHELYDGTMTATRSVLGVVEDGEAAAATALSSYFVPWPMPETAVVEAAAAAASFAAWPMRRVPAAASAVAGLPETTAVGAGDEEGEACCAVCLEGYVAGDALRTMPCAHAFHAGCIVEWLSFGNLCPLCRFRLRTQAEEDAAQAQQTRGSGTTFASI
ncbi:unnamed protein product [Urochloa humidicola]